MLNVKMTTQHDTSVNNEDSNADTRNSDRQPLVDSESQTRTEISDPDPRRRNFFAVAFALVSLVLMFGALAMPRWSSMVGVDGTHLGDYGLFVIKLLEADEFNKTSSQFYSLIDYFNAGELSLIICILIVLLFNIALTVMGIIVSLGCCPSYLNFLSAFSVFNVFAIVNYLVAMGLWLWVTYRIPYHNSDAQIRKIYTGVIMEFGYGFYIWLGCIFLLTLAAVCNILDYNLIRSACCKRQNSITLTTTHIPLRQPIRRIIVRLPSEPPDYREELSPVQSPLTPPVFPSHLVNTTTSFV